MLRNEAIANFRESLAAQAIETKQLLTNDAEVLWTNPAPKSWSAMQCLEHLILTGEYYQNGLRKKLLDSTIKSADHEIKSGKFGQKFANAMQPTPDGQRRARTRTSKKVNPPPSDISRHEKTIKDYLALQQGWEELLQQSEQVNWEKIRVASLIGPILRFYIYDAFAINIAHQNRHLLQAKEALEKVSLTYQKESAPNA
ncbi:MAG: DinB family protein [Bacteroidota bacterium]